MGRLVRIDEITKQELKDLEAFERERTRLHLPPVPKTFIRMDIHMPDGEHVLEYMFRSKSWVRNAYNVLMSHMTDLNAATGGTTYEAGKLPTKDITGSVRYHASNVWQMGTGVAGSFAGPAGSTSQGIVVGTGTGAENFEDHILGSLIQNGTGSGQLSYSAANAGTGAYNAGNKKFTATHARVMNNNSGGSIVVGEVGLYVPVKSYLSYNTMLCRDLLSSPVTVLNTAQLTVTYTFEVTYPA